MRWIKAHMLASYCACAALVAYDTLGFTRVTGLQLAAALCPFIMSPIWMPIELVASTLRRPLGRGDDMSWPLASVGWATYLSVLVVAAHWLGRASLRQRRRAAGLCVACGYDLRASSARCPECGKEIPS